MMQWNQWGNGSLIDTIEKELPESTFYWLLISILAAIAWIVYLTYYNSRILGLVLTAILNKVLGYGHIKFGSFSFSVLSGKVMFRDVHLITEDYSLRVQLGLGIFRWWRPLIQKDINEDLSHSETRVSIYLDTFELHVYNRSATYSQLEKLFGLDSLMVPTPENEKEEEDSKTRTITVQNQNKSKWRWRDLVPVIKLEISTGKIVFGNYLLPTSLSINFGDAHIVYTTKPASTNFDEFMHIIKCKADNLRVMLVPSPKYIGPTDEPPRFMGEGFVVIQSNDVDIYYYYDEPGLVPYEPEQVLLANGDVISRRTWPCWGMDVKGGKGTDISYGPWADRQRELLWKFFFPADYTNVEATQLPEPGQLRIYRSFDFKMSMQYKATADILFTKIKETQAVHMNMKAGSYLEFTIPWVVEAEGYVSKINGQLMHLDATTSLQFRELVECETLEFDITARYPHHWNEHQDWQCEFTACKATIFFIFHHKVFLCDLMDDWASKSRPDLFHFLPYTWHVSLVMKEFEFIVMANEYNWIDCFAQPPENAQIAFCGEMFDLTFDLPFLDYLPPLFDIRFFIRGESVDCRFYLPEMNTSRHLVQALSDNAKVMNRDGTVSDEPAGGSEKKWRRVTQKSLSWIDCWSTPIVAISIGYSYHPSPPTGDDGPRLQNMEPISTPDAEEQLLIPLRLVPLRPLRPKRMKMPNGGSPVDFDPTLMDPDLISLELEVGPSVLYVYGSLLRSFLHVKENYFGEDQKFCDYEETFPSAEKSSNFTHVSTDVVASVKEVDFDPRKYRPLHVKVQVTLHDIQAHLLKNCNEDGAPCPCVHLERLGFEMDKRYAETQLQVLISPAILVAKDDVERPEAQSHLSSGHLALSGLQVRGHAMFSHEGLPLDSETLEYAWMVEVTVGDITGRLTAPQLQGIVEAIQTFVFLVGDAENSLQRAQPDVICQHGLPQPECHADPTLKFPCPTCDDIKYRLTRASVDCVDLYLVEAGSALNLQAYPIRVSTCNLHGKSHKAGVTALVPHFNMKQFIMSTPITDMTATGDNGLWLEAGGLGLGPLNVDAAMALPSPEFQAIQDRFLKLHDKDTHRLWFLWPPDLSTMSPKVVGKCGCIGGCRFFGRNRNGVRFFQPSEQDFVDGVNSAVFQILCDVPELGYGQSVLQAGHLMFDIPGAALPVTPSKCKLLQRATGLAGPGSRFSVSTQQTSTTLVDDSTLTRRPVSLMPSFSSRSSRSFDQGTQSDLASSDRTLKDSQTIPSSDLMERTTISSGQSLETGSVPSEFLPESPMPDAYDTDQGSDRAGRVASSGSVTSLPEAVAKKRFGHERKHSYDARKISVHDHVGGSLSKPRMRESRGSLCSTTSRQSSLTSPVLRRLSSQYSVQGEGSLTSMTTASERFFSAAEDLSDAVTSDGDSPRKFLPPSYHARYPSDGSTSLLSESLEETLVPNYSASEGLLASGRKDSIISTDTESVGSFVSALSTPNASLLDVSTISSNSPTSPTSDTSRDQVPPLSTRDHPYQRYVEIDDGDITPTATEPEVEPDMDPDPEGSDDGFDTPSNFVDLHGQINQPITKSPLLMSCYVNHMTQLHCCHWSSPPPLPHLVAKSNSIPPEGSSSFHSRMSSALGREGSVTPAWIPQFSYHRVGFGPDVMCSKKEMVTPPSLSSPSSTSDFERPKRTSTCFEEDSDQDVGEDTDSEPELGFRYEDHVSETTAVVNLKGSIDVLISPLMLESLQRMVEAVTPTLASLHPSAVVDELHFQCSSAMVAQNKLKKKASQHECSREEGKRGEHSPDSMASTAADTKTSRLQVMVGLSKINICVLQVSLVEEMISFSALDQVRELTCVSVLAVCLDNITCQVLTNHHSHRSIEPNSDASPDSINKKAPGEAGKKGDTWAGECESDSMVELQQEELVGKLNIGRIHCQLRRLKRNFSDKVFLTAIAEHRSKVLFTFQHSEPAEGTPSSNKSRGEYRSDVSAEDIAGFIMFECGLEDINLTAAKRSGFSCPLTGDDEDMEEIDHLLGNMKHHMESEKVHVRNSDLLESETASMSQSHASGLGNSADDEASTRASQHSLNSQHATEGVVDTEAMDKLDGDASSCVLQVKKVWFNFAAPPPSPRKRRLDFTRNDWNLLSTVTPAVNAWMQPGHRAMVAVECLIKDLKYRVNTVLACIMTEALDVQTIHMPARSKYNKITSLSRMLQEDPSCQLMTVLRRYLRRVGSRLVEESLNVDTVPQLLTVQKGLLALTRQWKNILYMPLLADSNFKSKKRVTPYTVTFAIPNEDSVNDFQAMDDGELTVDNFDLVDEKTSLLKAEEAIHRVGSTTSLADSLPPSASELSRPGSTTGLNRMTSDPQGMTSGASSESAKDKRSVAGKPRAMSSVPAATDSPTRLTSASQRSQSLALPTAGSATIPATPRIKRNSSNVSFASYSAQSLSSMELGGTPMKPGSRLHSDTEKRADEDLYRWMQRQQEYTKIGNAPELHAYPSVGHDSLYNTGLSEHSQEDSVSMHRLAVAHSFLQLADAQVLFKPLLAAIGIHLGAVKSSAFMKKFGGNVSMQGNLQTLRVDIIDSEFSQGSSKSKHKGKMRTKKLPRLNLDSAFETPAFICDHFSIVVSMKDIVDFEKDQQVPGAGGLQWRRKSLRAVKMAMEHMEAKPTTTKVHFGVHANSVSQHVNMSLLRLVHQVVSMIENINETRVELSGRADEYRAHRKQDSKSSTATEHSSVDPQEGNLKSPMEPDTPTPESAGMSPIPTPTPSASKQANKPPPLKLESRPDRLPLFLQAGKSPKKFSLRKGKYESSKGSVDLPPSAVPDHVQSPPHSLNLSDVAIEMQDTSSPVVAEKTIVDEIKENTPKCWRTIYHLLELYSTMPETKTLGHRPCTSRLSVIDEETERGSMTHSLPRFDSAHRITRRFSTAARHDLEGVERQTPPRPPPPQIPSRPVSMAPQRTFTQSFIIREQTPLVVFGIAKVRRIHISATLSGLKLEADLQNVHASAAHRERVKGVMRRSSESSATAYVGHTMIVLLEGVQPNMQTVVTVNIAKSQGLYSSFTKRGRDQNSALVTIGKIDVDIPQHPVVLHGMVARSSRRLSSTLQEFMRPPMKTKSHDSVDGSMPSQQPSKHSELNELTTSGPVPGIAASKPAKTEPPRPPLVIHFKAVLQGLTIGASLLPSLKAQYKMGEVSGSGVSGKKARFTVDLPTHSLSFSSKVSAHVPGARAPEGNEENPQKVILRRQLKKAAADPDKSISINMMPSPPESPTPFELLMKRHTLKRNSSLTGVSTPSTLPSSASVDLPPIHIHADYRPHTADTLGNEGLTEGLTLRQGHYLNAVAEVGTFEHSLTTDLLNHLVFVQKVFMKEVNEVVQKVSGSDQPVPLWDERFAGPKDHTLSHLLYSLQFRLKGIQITATTPTSNAVRLETGSIELELSNRVQTASREGAASKLAAPKVFVKAQVDLNLALGTLLKNPMFEEAEPEFQQLASFTTRIGIRNALQDEMIPGVSQDQEALLITLKRPIVFVQPSAFDRAVLVWLNYKNAYEYWNEQRLALNKEVQTATQQVIDKIPLGNLAQQTSPALGTLFLQLTVEDLGICLPLQSVGTIAGGGKIVEESGAAVVLTLESTQISACSCASLVSKGSFNGFCLRFANDFEVTWDDWKPDRNLDPVMNAMVVPEGTYEVCSRTTGANQESINAKWILNVTWQMRGIDIHLDANIGKLLSMLGSTLTTMTGDVDAETGEPQPNSDDSEETEHDLFNDKVDGPNRKTTTLPEGLPEFVYDASLDPKTRARLIEKEMNEQAKVVQDLKQLGASQNTVDMEERKLAELEATVFHDFRQDIMKKLKRQSVKANVIRDKLGLGYKPAHTRSKSGPAIPVVSPTRKEAHPLGTHKEDRHESIISNGHSRAASMDYKTPSKPFLVPQVQVDHVPPTKGDPFKNTTPKISFNFPSSGRQGKASTSSSEEDDPELTFLHRASRRPRMSADRVQSPSGSLASNQLQGALGAMEPNIDFEMDIKVNIDSGKCVLHPKEVRADIDHESKRMGKRDSREMSPQPQRKRGQKKGSQDNLPRFQGHRQLGPQQSQMIDNRTVFFLPGLNVAVHYSSSISPSGGSESPIVGHSRHELDPSAATSTPITGLNSLHDLDLTLGKKVASKKANLYAWLSLQQLSEEMLISPVLLDFLEQALEPIPMLQFSQYGKKSVLGDGGGSSSTGSELDNSASSLTSTGTYSYASFPVDVVVYIRVQPSLVRFSCLPVSRVECLLRLPSLDLVFSTKRSDVEGSIAAENTPPTRSKSYASAKKHSNTGGLPRPGSATRMRSSSGHSNSSESIPGGGLSVTGCLADFSLFIFHPYGHGSKKTSLSVLENSFKRSTPAGGKHENLSSPLGDPTGRKDSLSLNVEFVKVNISRSRKATDPAKPSDYQSKAANVIRFSAICDIGSASFKYDMRRLSEILALPKAWYRRTLARRVFLGEETTNVLDDSDTDLSTNSTPVTPESPLFAPVGRAQTVSSIHMSHLIDDRPTHRRVASEDRNVPLSLDFKRELDDLNSRTPSGSGSTPQSPSDETQKLSSSPSRQKPFPGPGRSSRRSRLEQLSQPRSAFKTPVTPGKAAMREWETLVQFAVNLSRLDVGVNMSNVMGNCIWATTDLKSQGCMSIDSSGYKNMRISAGLAGSKLEAKGGIVGGNIEVHDVQSSITVSEDPHEVPDHRVQLSLYTLETKLDYMGSAVLMGRISSLTLGLRDEWGLDMKQLRGITSANRQSTAVLVHGDLSWDKFHLMISRSTTPDLLKMATKIEEFLHQQLSSSKRVLSTFAAIPSKAARGNRRKSMNEPPWINEIRHHRHWQKVLEHVAGVQLSMLTFRLPEEGTSLGGTIALQGGNLSLACFHGINFRSKSWAIFTMDEPFIVFATDSQFVGSDDGSTATLVSEKLSFELGRNRTEKIREKHMATICKLSRGHYMPPPFTKVSDWFHYAFGTTELADLDSFPQVTPMGSESPTEQRSLSRKSQADYAHETETIFALPSLMMHLETLHLQQDQEPDDEEGTRPVVECNFVTEFEDHIFVAMDAEAILFVHDLVRNYVKEKDRGSRGSYRAGQSPETEKKIITDPTAALKEDLREFHCKTWRLEPTIRLLSWAGKRIDPVGVDYILQKLGFQHARLTIPKWMQRGAMDPLDKVLSLLVDKLIHVLRETPRDSS